MEEEAAGGKRFSRNRNAGFLLGAGILALAALLRFLPVRIPFLAEQVREWVVAAGLIFLLLGIKKRNPFGGLSLDRKIRLFGLGLLGLGGLGRLASSMESWIAGGSAVLRLLGTSLFQAVTAILVTALAVGLFGLFRDLVFVQQGRRTQRLFAAFECSVVIRLIFALAPSTDRALFPAQSQWADGPNPPLILTAGLAVLLGFRSKWIPFLNRRSKTAFFLLGLPVAALFMSQRESLTEAVFPFSEAAVTVLVSLLTAFGIYLVISLVSLLIHLPTAGLLDRRMREVRSFQELSAALGADLKKSDLIAKIPVLACRMVEADTVCLELDEGAGFNPVSLHRNRPDSPGMPPEAVTAGIRRQVLERARPVLMNNAARQGRGRKAAGPSAGSLLAAPVAFQSRVIGVLYALKSGAFGFVEESQGLFQAFAHQAAISLQNAALVEQSINREKAEEELRLAHEAQMRLLPQSMPAVKGFELDGVCVTANEIGGDFYDVIAAGRDRVDIVVGDVSGKGAAAAFIMAETKGAIRALAGRHRSPKDILCELNGFFREQGEPGLFLTMAYAILTPSRRRIRIARAGHCPVGLIRQGGVRWLEPRGLGLGLADDRIFRPGLREQEIALTPGDRLFFYTDGLVEARNAGEEEFGEERLTRLLAGAPSSDPAAALVRSVIGRLEKFTRGVARHDDVTVLALRCGVPRRGSKG
ncbi:MAG: SpoIIE family protein phosphatase [bacterium]|nr:SpoIIE family protein phosphatase [bacterium]